MGEVYRARDLRLNRDVAIKILSGNLASDPAGLGRFEREARALAAVHHPNIATIFSVEDRALVMELVDGPTLADVIAARRSLPAGEALAIARQIASALDAAHERGLVHRDLKPANIKVCNDGTVKVLDFGLAKMVREVASAGDLPTLSGAATLDGTLVGTAPYMSPEQARGGVVDRRTDIWAFGCVLYEMLAGRRAFAGDTTSDTIAAILTRDPDWSALPAATPAAVERLLRRALERDPKRRLRDIADAEFVLDAAEAPGPPRTTAAPRLPSWVYAVLIVILVAGAALGWALHHPAPPATASLIRTQIEPPPEATIDANMTTISPDGKTLAFVAQSATGLSLWVRPIEAPAAREVPESSGATFPFWSPDSRTIAFFARGKIMRAELPTGVPTPICDVPSGRGGTWNANGVIVYNAVNDGGLMRVSASGGAPAPLTTLDRSRSEDSHRFPWFLPDGRHFLFFVRSAARSDVRGIYASSLDDPSKKTLIALSDSSAIFAPIAGAAGALIWLRDRTLVAQRFDVTTLTRSAEPVTLADGIAPLGLIVGVSPVSASRTGTLVYGTPVDPASRLTWFDRAGKVTGMLGDTDVYGGLALSPDGARVAVSRASARVYDGSQIWITDVARGVFNRVTLRGSNTSSGGLMWSPDGRRIAYVSAGAPPNLAILDLERQEERLFRSRSSQERPAWTPDGRLIIVNDASNDPQLKTRQDLQLIDPARDGAKTPYLQTPFAEMNARFSPDGAWVAYTSDQSDKREVYVESYPRGKGVRRVSKLGGDFAHWVAGSRELFFVSGDDTLTAVPVRTAAGGIDFGDPQPLFKLPDQTGAYDVTPDGARIIATVPASVAPPSMSMLQNWAAALTK